MYRTTVWRLYWTAIILYRYSPRIEGNVDVVKYSSTSPTKPVIKANLTTVLQHARPKTRFVEMLVQNLTVAFLTLSLYMQLDLFFLFLFGVSC